MNGEYHRQKLQCILDEHQRRSAVHLADLRSERS